MEDPLDGTTADKFDTILRTIAEGQHPTWGTQSQIAPQNLIVCIDSGVFQTSGQYDWLIDAGHTKSAVNTGFTVEKNWRIHGHGANRTALKLIDLITDQFVASDGTAFPGGHNIVIGTHSLDASGIEISDLAIDANHDELNKSTGLALNLSAIVLRSTGGGHWIHDVKLVGASGDLGDMTPALENFPVLIWGDSENGAPSESRGNLVEKTTLEKPGKRVGHGRSPGGSGIGVANASAEVRNNLVQGYEIGYGGWSLREVWFHDNVAKDTGYGFNVDSFDNLGVLLESNQIIHPVAYGIVIGGSHPEQRFSGWRVLNNTIELSSPDTIGIVLQGQVKGATFSGNKVFTDDPNPKGTIAIWSYSSGNGVINGGNIYQDNQFDRALAMDFSADPDFDTNCRIGNRDLQDRPLADFPDNGGPSGCAAVAFPSRNLREPPPGR